MFTTSCPVTCTPFPQLSWYVILVSHAPSKEWLDGPMRPMDWHCAQGLIKTITSSRQFMHCILLEAPNHLQNNSATFSQNSSGRFIFPWGSSSHGYSGCNCGESLFFGGHVLYSPSMQAVCNSLQVAHRWTEGCRVLCKHVFGCVPRPCKQFMIIQ